MPGFFISAPAMDTYSEQYRAECEARYVVDLRTNEARRAYLDGVRAKRGKDATDKLREDAQRELERRRKLTRQP